MPANSVRLHVDGRVVLEASMPFYPVRPDDVVLGANPLGMSTSTAEFRGEIFAIEPHQPAPAAARR
jgi:hypothetical protein